MRKNLEQIELNYSSADDAFDRESLFENKNNHIISELGQAAFYREVFDPAYDKDSKPAQGCLIDDYGDIYRDIRIELNKIKTGTDKAIEDAFWQLKSGFNIIGANTV